MSEAALWFRVCSTYLGCWVMVRIAIDSAKKAGIGTFQIPHPRKRLVFLLPLTKIETFPLYLVVYMACNHLVMTVELVLLLVRRMGVEIRVWVFALLSMSMGFGFILCASLFLIQIIKKDWRERKDRKGW